MSDQRILAHSTPAVRKAPAYNAMAEAPMSEYQRTRQRPEFVIASNIVRKRYLPLSGARLRSGRGDGEGALGEDACEVLAVLNAGVEVARWVGLCSSLGGSVLD